MKIKFKSGTAFCLAAACAMMITGCSDSGDTLVTSYDQIDFSTVPSTAEGNGGEVTLNSGDLYAVITIKDYGSIKLKLFNDAAPVGVKNFIELASSGYYEGKTIHRVVKNFMMQGGSANGDGRSVASDPSFSVEYCKEMRHFYGALCYANAGGINGSQFYIVNNHNPDECNVETLQNNKDYYDEMKAQAMSLAESATDPDEKAYYQSYADYMQSLSDTMSLSISANNDLTAEMRAKYKEQGGTSSLDGGYTVFGQMVEGGDVLDKVSEAEVKDNGSGEISSPVQTITIESVKIYIKK